MISQEAEADLFFNYVRKIDSGHVYYDESRDQILHLTTKCHVYFKYDLLWKLISERNSKPRRVKTITEAKEIMNSAGYIYLGQL